MRSTAVAIKEKEREMFGRLPRLRRAGVLLAPVLALALLAGCGSAGDPSGAASAASTSATATATATATPLPTTTVASGSCGKYFPSTVLLTPVNGLVVTHYSGLGNLA